MLSPPPMKLRNRLAFSLVPFDPDSPILNTPAPATFRNPEGMAEEDSTLAAADGTEAK